MTRNKWILFGLFLALMLPFLNKAFLVDDWVYLTGANRILDFPQDPYGGAIQFFNIELTYYQTTHPPLYFFFVSFLVKLFGEVEWLLRLGNLLFPFLGMVFTYRLANRFCKHPFLATLTVITSTGYVIMSHDLMTDVPLMTLFLIALDLALVGLDKNKAWPFWLCGLTSTAAWMVSYQGLMLTPLILFYCWMYGIAWRRVLIAIAIPIVGFAVWSAYTWAAYGIPHIIAAFDWPGGKVHFYEPEHVFNKFRAFTIYLGFFCVPWLLAFGWQMRDRIAKFDGPLIAIVAISLALIPDGYTFVNQILIVFGMSVGLLMVCFIFARFGLMEEIYVTWKDRPGLRWIGRGCRYFAFDFKRPESLDLRFVGFFAVFFYLVCVYMAPYGIPRYFLPIFVPVAILLTDAAAGFLNDKRFKQLLAYGFALQLGLTVILAYSDYEYAETIRTMSAELAEGKYYKNEKVWFSGELGTRYYMEKHGFEYLFYQGKGLKKGDVILRAINDFGPSYGRSVYPRVKLDRSIEITSWNPFKTHSRFAQAGFYSHYFSLTPFTISNEPLEIFNFYRVVK